MTETRKEVIKHYIDLGYCWSEIAGALGETEDCADSIRLQYGRATGRYKDKARTSTVKNVPNIPTDAEQLIDAHGYDPEQWELVGARKSEWDANINGNVERLSSSRISIRPVENSTKDMLSAFMNVKPDNVPSVPEKRGNGERILELTLADLHLNLLAWHGTTGQDYDLNIAVHRVLEVVASVIARANGEHFKEVILPLGNDLFNSEGSTGATHKGTPQDEDTRGPKVFSHALNMFVGIVEEFRKHADTVRVVLVPGNHDRDTSMMLAYAVLAWYHDSDDVIVDTSAMNRKYLEYGKCMIALGHMHAEKGRIRDIIPAEAAEIWGRTKYREAHGAHHHTESVVEYAGFILRRAPTPSARSEYSCESGYSFRQRHLTYVWHPERGREETWEYNV